MTDPDFAKGIELLARIQGILKERDTCSRELKVLIVLDEVAPLPLHYLTIAQILRNGLMPGEKDFSDSSVGPWLTSLVHYGYVRTSELKDGMYYSDGPNTRIRRERQ